MMLTLMHLFLVAEVPKKKEEMFSFTQALIPSDVNPALPSLISTMSLKIHIILEKLLLSQQGRFLQQNMSTERKSLFVIKRIRKKILDIFKSESTTL